MNKLHTVLIYAIMAASVLGEASSATDKTPDRQANTSFTIRHRFESVDDKNEFLTAVFATLGKREGQVLASVKVVYSWQFDSLSITVIDTTGHMGIPGVTVSIYKNPNNH